MDVMTTEVFPGTWTVADRDQLPDDPLHRYEVIDGTLLVSAAPIPDHQGVADSLLILLRQVAPATLRVLSAPTDVVLAEDTVAEPDIIVARREDFTAKNLPGPPLLAVEVLSPSTRMIDLNLKKERYERAGIASYWVIDPADLHLTAYELRDGAYHAVADLTADGTWTATSPFEVTITPNTLRY